MKRLRFTDSRIMAILKQVEAGTAVAAGWNWHRTA
jgi:hypothetical protein